MASIVPEKPISDFRNYDDTPEHKRLRAHYRDMRVFQTWNYVEKMYQKWHGLSTREMSIREAFDLLGDYVDPSDPDADGANLMHMFQSAEGARANGEPDHWVFTLLIHDLGKVLSVMSKNDEEGQGPTCQYGVVGDTFAVGVPLPDCTILNEFNQLSPDKDDPRFNSEFGVYQPGCGIMNLRYAYGHDEYLYNVLKGNGINLPHECMAFVRLHSCYPLHKGGAYKEFYAEGDEELVATLRKYNAYDLYTKADVEPVPEKLWPYYEELIAKFAPGTLKW